MCIDKQSENCVLGIDIGTTSISASVIDIDRKCIAETITVKNRFAVSADSPDFSEQDANGILDAVLSLVNGLTRSYTNIKSIGITGQMHGIVYIDEHGGILSPLYTWQDGRAGRMTDGGISYCDEIFSATGERISTGYGLATHYYNLKNGLVPDRAAKIATVMDAAALKLTESTSPVMHASNAASLGLFDVAGCDFYRGAIEKLGIDADILPRVTDEFETVGYYKGIPVSVAIGDNQASVLGALKNLGDSVLVNIGTGSQISIVTDRIENLSYTETRPLVKSKYLVCGSALCGGAAYALLERFFREFCLAAGLGGESQYEALNLLLYDAYKSGKQPLSVDTAFRGKRGDRTATGSIVGITDGNFTPGQMALGFVYGMCRELYGIFDGRFGGRNRVVASGNAVQKIPAMESVIADVFKMNVSVSQNTEEAAVGAALFSALSAGGLSELENFSEFIEYRDS